MKLIAVAIALLAGSVGAGFVDIVATHTGAVATAVCTAPVLPSAPLINRYCPKPGTGYLEGVGGPLQPTAAPPAPAAKP